MSHQSNTPSDAGETASTNSIVPAHIQEVGNIAVYDRITNPMEAVKVLGAAIFKSGIFNVEKPEIGEVIAMECLAQRKSPLELARTYHFVEGKLAMKADAMLAKYQQAGGRVTWVLRTDSEVKAVFHYRESSVEIHVTYEEFVRKGVVFGKDGKTLKHNWKAWPKQMLTARAISEGVRLVAPETAWGTYAVEELSDTETSRRQVATVVSTLDEIVPDFQRDAAVRVLRKVGHLTEAQGWADIPADLANTLSHPKRSNAFLTAVKAEYETNI